ncbi:MAG: DUF1963 domain-containing protein [Pirellulales bacterium]
MDADEIRTKLAKPAIVMELGGFRPPDSPSASWFGRVNLSLPGELWPKTNGKPMHALCQLNLTELPFRAHRLDDVELIAVFIGPDDLPVDAPNGDQWCLRAYQKIGQLRPLAPIDTGSTIKSLPMRPAVVQADFPCWEDVPFPLPEELEESYYDLLGNIEGFKLGGWPSLIQSEIYWAPWNKHPIAPEYVFQIDTTDKGNWAWGDNGTGYFGRGTAAGHHDEWTLAWQCY